MPIEDPFEKFWTQLVARAKVNSFLACDSGHPFSIILCALTTYIEQQLRLLARREAECLMAMT